MALRRRLKAKARLAVVRDQAFGTQDPDTFTFDELRDELKATNVGVELDHTTDSVAWHDDLGDSPPQASFARQILTEIVYLGARGQNLMAFQPPAYGVQDARLADGLFDAQGVLDKSGRLLSLTQPAATGSKVCIVRNCYGPPVLVN